MHTNIDTIIRFAFHDKSQKTVVHNFFLLGTRASARPSGHKLSLPFQLFSAIIQAASGRSKAVIGKFSAHGAGIRAEIRFFPFAWVNEVFEVSAGGILDCERSAVALHFSSGLPVASFPWQECKREVCNVEQWRV